MVKKIRLIEDEVSDEELDRNDMQSQFMELAKSMDWKLWEMLQIMQRLEKQLGTTTTEDKTDAKSKK
mgnify:CR=1 FL=1